MNDRAEPQQTIPLTSPAHAAADDFEHIVFRDDMIDAPDVDGTWNWGETRVEPTDGWDLVPFVEGADTVMLPDATERWQHFNRLGQEQALAEYATGGLASAALAVDPMQTMPHPGRAVRRAWPRRAMMAGVGVIALAGILYGASLFDSRAAVGLFQGKTASAEK
ncbi:MAG: hypothetical protein AB7P50_06250 [Alphaproteobacteria bacterium]